MDEYAQGSPTFDKGQFLEAQSRLLTWLRLRFVYDEYPIQILLDENYVLAGTHEGYQRVLDSLAVEARMYDSWSGLMTTPV